VDGFPVVSVPGIELVKDDSETGVWCSMCDNLDGLELLGKEREPQDLGPRKGGSSDILLQELDGESGLEMTEMVQVQFTGGKGEFTQWVHCEFFVSPETIRLVVTQQVCDGFF
jgi:hypothetical protein